MPFADAARYCTKSRQAKARTEAERAAALLLKHCDGLTDAKVIEAAERSQVEAGAALREPGVA